MTDEDYDEDGSKHVWDDCENQRVRYIGSYVKSADYDGDGIEDIPSRPPRRGTTVTMKHRGFTATVRWDKYLGILAGEIADTWGTVTFFGGSSWELTVDAFKRDLDRFLRICKTWNEEPLMSKRQSVLPKPMEHNGHTIEAKWDRDKQMWVGEVKDAGIIGEDYNLEGLIHSMKMALGNGVDYRSSEND